MEERLAASSYGCSLAALRADPEAGNLRFPVPLLGVKPGSGLPCSRNMEDLTPVLDPSSDLPVAAAEHGNVLAGCRDPVDLELGAADHEVDVDLALVDERLLGLVLDRERVA